MRKFLIVAVLFAATAFVSAGLAGPASATTSACRGGPYTGICGTMVDHENFPLAFAARGASAANNTPVIGFPNLDGDAGSDFVVLPFAGGPSVMFIFAPHGRISNMCIANPAGGSFGFNLILRACNGSVYQRFNQRNVAPGTVVLTSLADGRIVHSNGQGASLSAVPLPATLTGADVWSFAH
jgi:hypothetical protein